MDGILIVDKPQSFTSHDVVALARKHFNLRKVGHAGTLDPMATGVLVLLIGKATKASNLISADDKEYDATLVLGARSDTGDAWGKIEKGPADPLKLSHAAIEDVFKRYIGQILQKPPAYSAVKVKGRKLYEFARKGITVDVDARKITVHEMTIKNIALPEVSFTMRCSKGTYVRQIAVDIGEDLGCGAYLSRLCRTRSGKFALSQAVTVEEMRKWSVEDLRKRIVLL